jgi:pyruvate formate-lyase activating enzyme-like uncharacterized protein
MRMKCKSPDALKYGCIEISGIQSSVSMSTVCQLPRGSLIKGRLPKGCALCQKGAKMVLLVTGRCSSACYYCPLSEEKAGRDVVFADELRVKSPQDILLEARLIEAEGTGITGGDPLCAPRRTIEFIGRLKRKFGKGHHIHLYTAGRTTVPMIWKLAKAGLDEIRFHPPQGDWDRFKTSKIASVLCAALGTGMAAGAEVPAIPGEERRLLRLAGTLEDMGAGFLNLNELEYSQTNFRRLNRIGFTVRDDVSSGVLGSERTAMRVVGRFDGKMAVHYCSSGFKDGVQLRRRIMRRARNIARPYQAITADGTLLTGIIEGPPSLVGRLRKRFDVPGHLVVFNRRMRRVEVAPWVLERIGPSLREKAYIVEEYPTADRLEVERIPL